MSKVSKSEKRSVNKFINTHFIDNNFENAFTPEGFERFKTFFGTVERGNSHVYTAPFAGKADITTVMAQWNTTLLTIKDKWPSLYDFEQELRGKVGPLSVQLPISQRIQDIQHYFEDILMPSKPIDGRAISATVKEFSPVRGLNIRSQPLTIEKMKKSSQAGAPFWKKRKYVINSTSPCDSFVYPGRHPDVVSILPQWNGETPAVVGWRGQEGGIAKSDVKQRVVWMFPFSVNISELQVYQPFTEICQHYNLIPAWVSMDAVDTEITSLFDTKGKNDLIVCTDFSKFDQHFNNDLQDCAESILSQLLARNQTSQNWLRNVFPIKYYIPLIWQILPKTAICYPGYSCFEGHHGMASGSGGTNADETIVHRTLQYEAAILHNQTLNPHSLCLGDDGILSYPSISVDDVVDVYQSHGQEMNLTKQYASTQDCTFLRRWHHADYRIGGRCVGVYSTMRAIGRLRYLERYMDPDVWSKEMVALRQLSIIENCKWHPLREEFAQFCMKRDKYRLGIDIPGFLDNVQKYAMESIDYMPDFLGYTKTLQGVGPEGIADWWIVKYLKSVS